MSVCENNNSVQPQHHHQPAQQQQQQQSTQSIADYLAQLLKDRKQLAAFPNVFNHVERLLDEGKLQALNKQSRSNSLRHFKDVGHYIVAADQDLPVQHRNAEKLLRRGV
uniref:STAR protein homodimerisation region domain-containing protein n=2 Tax=Glossina TaxID=7393 RepID=A0A1A9WTD3_9MUSC